MFRLPSFPLYATLADKLGWWAVRALCVAVLAFLLAPILVMVPLSFSESSFLAYPIHGWSLKWYQHLFESPEWARAPRHSIIVGPGATLVATGVGTHAA
ncbi:MAG: ABC transporter permease, partial [Acidovorax sp.]|nr:ABC transporter permease [Acidovorax sp.]